MDLLIAEAIDLDVARWLQSRHRVGDVGAVTPGSRYWLDLLASTRGVLLPLSVPVDTRFLRAAPRLVAIGRLSASVDNIDTAACAEAGVELIRSPTASARSEAEFVIGALLSLLRRMPVATSDGALVGRELGAARVGLVGMPPAAQATARLLAAFGARAVGYDPAVHASDPLWTRWRVEPLGLPELLAACDAVCVMLPAFSRYHRLLGERYLPYCKPDQVIVCTGSSSVFDETALAHTLATRRVAAAWFDSLEPGALDEGRPLAGIDTLQVTPCVAGTTRESRLRSAWTVARRLDAVLAQTRPAAARPDAAIRSPWPSAVPDPASDRAMR